MVKLKLNEKGKNIIKKDRTVRVCTMGYGSVDEFRVSCGFNVEYTGILTAADKENGIYRFILECRTTEDRVQVLKEVGRDEIFRMKSALEHDFMLPEDSYEILPLRQGR